MSVFGAVDEGKEVWVSSRVWGGGGSMAIVIVAQSE